MTFPENWQNSEGAVTKQQAKKGKPNQHRFGTQNAARLNNFILWDLSVQNENSISMGRLGSLQTIIFHLDGCNPSPISLSLVFDGYHPSL